MQKTITITFEAQEPSQTIQGTIAEQIKTFKENEELARSQRKQRVKHLDQIKNEFMSQLNQEVGEDVFFNESGDEGKFYPSFKRNHVDRKQGIAFGVKLGFNDGMTRNTCYSCWELWFQSPTSKVQLGELNYLQPNLDVIEVYLVDKVRRDGKIILINDVSEIHKHLEKDYLTYFTKEK